MDKGLIFNKHVGWNFSETLINVQLGSVSENPSKIAITNKKLELKVEDHNLE